MKAISVAILITLLLLLISSCKPSSSRGALITISSASFGTSGEYVCDNLSTETIAVEVGGLRRIVGPSGTTKFTRLTAPEELKISVIVSGHQKIHQQTYIDTRSSGIKSEIR